MNCEAVRSRLSMFLYGELSLEEEQSFQEHLDGCEGCRNSLEREKALHAALDQREVPVPAALLARCRLDLSQRLEAAPAGRGGLAGWLRRAFPAGFGIRPVYIRPFGAVALVALGFLGARLVGPTPGGLQPVNESAVARVRYVQPGPSGRIRLVVDETRQRVITGDVANEQIQRLLLAAARDPGDPGLRVESVGLLKAKGDSSEVRRALLQAVQNDSNAGVRLKALEGLKPFAGDPEIRQVLSRVLLADDNPGVRIQAIDLLTQQKEEEIVGVLQELLEKEDNNYVRMRSQRALQEMNASPGTF